MKRNNIEKILLSAVISVIGIIPLTGCDLGVLQNIISSDNDITTGATDGLDESQSIKRIYSSFWDRTGETETENNYAELFDRYYVDLQKVVQKSNIEEYANGELFPASFDYENTPEYFEFYIEYEYGNTLSGFSDDPEVCKKFKPVAKQFQDYFDGYISQYRIK